MQVLKDKKSLQDSRKAKRSATNETIQLFEFDSEEIDNKETILQNYDDDHTNQMFDGQVSVTIDTGISEEIENLKCVTEDLSKPGNINHRFKKEPTKLEKALKIAKVKMNSSSKKGKYKKSDKTKLLHKAMGSGKLGNKVSFKKK